MLLASIPPGDLAPFIFAIVAVGVAGIVTVICVVAVQWKHMRIAAYNARLKQLMIERGMSASDIERVMAADPKIAADRTEWQGIMGMIHGPRKTGLC
jgi:hypothetical protein